MEWTQNNTILIQNPVESSTNPLPLLVNNLNMNGMDFEQTKVGMDYDHAGSMQVDMNPINFDDPIRRRRKRRSAENDDHITYRNYNRYTQRITENLHQISRRSTFSVNDVILSNLPINRTIMFDCDMAEEGQCVAARFSVHNFRVGNVPIIVALNFTVDLNKIGNLSFV